MLMELFLMKHIMFYLLLLKIECAVMEIPLGKQRLQTLIMSFIKKKRKTIERVNI